MNPEITICIGWSGDEMYSIDYVNKLYRAVQRNTTIEHDFLLRIGPEAQKPGRLNGLDSGINIFHSKFSSWWTGSEGLQNPPPGVHTTGIFCLGLDCVIVGNLDDLLLYPSQFAAMKDYPSHACPEGCEKDVCMDVWLSRDGACSPLWDEYVKAGEPTWDCRNIPANSTYTMGGQGWLNTKPRPLPIDVFPENWVISYKLGVKKQGIPADCKIVSFHGRPKPHEVQDEFIKEHWK